ncbi:36.4 kDa proline-rich protein-like [Melia azedarach]|uniref:36.4 kDa proline-rich protein-like n=1 Tax=Melia azedarach TaxID=155640 RepID=A0ACC1X4R9_MELAZ|nr:36.4 kDa proline-rich protein-like [Melia azedarach]
MAKSKFCLILLLNLSTLLSSLACDCSSPPPHLPRSSNCPPPPPPPPPSSNCPPPPHFPNPKSPPPVVKPPPSPPFAKPPPKVRYPPPFPRPQTCPIDALKLGACVDVLGGLIHIGIGSSAKEECCPLLEGLVDLDAALCLCTAIRVKLLNIINLVVPVALEVLVGCGKHPPPGFQCP